MKILVIGATGMLGNHTARAVIAAGHELFVGHRASSDLTSLADLEYHSRICDLNDESSIQAALQGVDAVINCAGYYPTAPLPWQEDVHRALSQMDAFYRACEQSSLHKIVYLGAAIALPLAPPGRLANADDSYPQQPANRNNYLQVKWALDNQARQKAQQGLPVVIGIPSMTLGEYDAGPTTGRLIVEIANRTLPAYVAGDRNLVYAGDAGRGLVLACEKGRVGERYIFGAENHSMDALVSMITVQTQTPTPRKIPLWLAKTISAMQAVRFKLLGGEAPKLDKTAIAVLSLGQQLDFQKSVEELGYQPEVSIDQAIRRALLWFREHGYVKSPGSDGH